MPYRKGELSKPAIDRGWPHQVALEARFCSGDQYVTLHYFCKDLSLCRRGHTFVRGDRYYTVFCFSEREHAELFREKFGGKMIHPKDRPRWPR
jgi:hypothetical protein